MRRLLLAVACVVAVVVGLPATSSADPAAPSPPCAAAGDRISVPAGSAVIACLRDGRLVVTDSTAVPVVARPGGDVGTPTLLDPVNDPAAAILRAAVPDGQALMPGESAAWPVGSGDGRLQVAPLTGVAVARSLAAALPSGSDEVATDTATALGALVGVAGAALDQQRACQQGGNFLVVTACQVRTATAIGQALRDDVPWSFGPVARDVMLDRNAWQGWIRSGAAAERAVSGDQTVVLAAAVPAVPAAPAPDAPAVTVVSAPAPAPAGTPAAPAAGSAGAPQAPSGTPAVPLPAVSPPPAASVPSRRPTAAELLQALIAKARQAQQAAPHGGTPAPAPGKGQGNGHGHGR